MAEEKQKEIGIREVYQPTDEQKEVIQMVYTRRDQMADSEDRQEAEKTWDQAEKQWESWRTKRVDDDWQSNHVVPITTSVVETALSEIVKQNLRPFVLPRGREDQMKARVMQSTWDYAWEVSDGDMANYDAIKGLLIFGTTIAQEYYRVDRRKVGSVVGKKGEEKEEYKEIIDYDDVCTEIVKLQDFYVDEFARGFTGPFAARDCIRRYVMHIDDFHAMYDGSVWDHYENAKFVKPGGDVNYYEFFKPPTGLDTSKQVEVLHYWNKPKDKFIIVANDVLIRNRPNPYKHKELPFARAVDIKRVHKFYGKGEPELLESIQDEVNVLRRMIIDRNHLDIDKMFLVSNKLGLNDEDLMARPHGLIPTDDVNGAKPVEYGDIPRSVELSLKNLEDDATISTGINPRAQAMPTAGTATEAAILKESTLRRIETKIWLFKREYLMRIGRLRMANILQFYSQPKLEKIVGEKNSEEYKKQVELATQNGSLTQVDGEDYIKTFRSIRTEGKELSFDAKGQITEKKQSGYSFFELKPEYYLPYAGGGYDLKFNAGANIEISKPLMQSKILELFDRIYPVAMSVPNSYDPVKLTDMVIADYFDKNPDDLKPDQQPVDEQQQRLELQMQLASMEIQQMMKGLAVPATPFASPVHTRIILEFMNSPEFQKLPNDSPVIKAFTDHVIGEMIAQENRGTQGAGAPLENSAMNGESMPPGKTQTGGRLGNGMLNKPGGMKTPQNKMSDALPSLNTGGNPNV